MSVLPSERSLPSLTEENQYGGLGFTHGFIASLAVIVVSEIGDKTFFIAAIMSMKHSRLLVFAGAISALALMTVISVIFGYTANIIPRIYITYVSTLLFAIFGLKMLREGYHMAPNQGMEELEEVQSDLHKREEELEKEILIQDAEIGAKKKVRTYILVFKIMFQAFALTFFAELGDRSQISTIILAAREDVYGVILGGIVGHSLCTGLAVIGGRFIAQKISVRTVTIAGGIVFLLFAFSAIFLDLTNS